MRAQANPPGCWAFRLTATFSVAAVLATFAGCRNQSNVVEPPPPVVGVVESRKANVPVVVRPNGTTRALEEVALRARVKGFLNKRNFTEGSMVKSGDLVLVIEEDPYEASLATAKAKQEEALASLQKAERSKAREIATAQLAYDKAQHLLYGIEERRSRNLFSRNAASREDLDKAEAELQKAHAQVQGDQAKLEQANSDYEIDILAAKALLAGSNAQVRNAQLDLGYCRIHSPIDGRIGEAKVKVGNLVGPGASGSDEFSELATVQQLDPMGIDILISSRFLALATELNKSRLKVHLTRPSIDGDVEHPYEGECFFIDNHIDSTTSTFLAKARIPNPEGSLLPGEYVKLRMTVDQYNDVVIVPEQAVLETQAGPVVYVVNPEGKVVVQRVEAAEAYEGMRIITDGLDAGVSVIVEGLQVVRPDMTVKTERAILPSPVRTAEPSRSAKSKRARSATMNPGGAAPAPKAPAETSPAPAPPANPAASPAPKAGEKPVPSPAPKS